MQIAESVLSKLPSTMHLTEARTMNQAVRETKISSIENDNNDEKERMANEDEGRNAGDLV